MSSARIQKTRTLVLLAAALGITSLGDDCDGDIVNDPTFRDWCGDTLCAWTLDVGSISQAPTWNADDLGVSFNDMPTQISQVTDESAATCILFTTVANIAPTADMEILVDFDNDGTIDFSQQLASAAWQNLQAEITAPSGYQGITFHIRKNGSGTAVLAEMRIQSTTGCTAAPPPFDGLPLGDACGTDGECASGICDGVCALCTGVYEEECSGGQTCEYGPYGFAQCGPGGHKGTNGAACTTGSDCASDVCEGVVVLGNPAEVDAGSEAGVPEPPCLPAMSARDAGAPDAQAADAQAPDAIAPDGATPDGATQDSATPDAGGFGGFFGPPCVTTLVRGKGGTCR